MSIIQTVSYEEDQEKQLHEKLKEHLGVHKLEVHLDNGSVLRGLISEISENYMILMEDGSDVLIPLPKIQWVRYER